MIEYYHKVKTTAGGFHSWWETSLGFIRKPNSFKQEKPLEIKQEEKVGEQVLIKEKTMNKLAFLTSTRFWGLVIIAIVGLLDNEGIIPSSVGLSIITLVGGFIGIRTVDRFSEKLGK